MLSKEERNRFIDDGSFNERRLLAELEAAKAREAELKCKLMDVQAERDALREEFTVFYAAVRRGRGNWLPSNVYPFEERARAALEGVKKNA